MVLNNWYISSYMCKSAQNPEKFKDEAYVLRLVCCTVYRVTKLDLAGCWAADLSIWKLDARQEHEQNFWRRNAIHGEVRDWVT